MAWEYRGVRDLVYAEVTADDSTYTTGTVKTLAPVANIAKQTANSSETHYYDNDPTIVINSTGADTITIDCAGIELSVLAEITGQVYQSTTGAMFERGVRTPKYFAIGYKTKKTNGNEIYVWRLKGMFSIPDENSATENDGTDANGVQLVYTGISTTHEFTDSNGTAKSVVVDTELNLCTSLSTFFSTVQTPDTITP